MAKMVDCENIRDLKIFDPDRELVPVVHGTWVRTGQSFLKADKFICYSCSICGFDIEKTKYQYCPHCGAKMDL